MTTSRPEWGSVVNRSLTRKQRRRIENGEFVAFIRRIIRAHSRRVAAGDIEAIADLASVADEVNMAMHYAIYGLRLNGYSWADIALRLGVTRQAAQQRYGTVQPSK